VVARREGRKEVDRRAIRRSNIVPQPMPSERSPVPSYDWTSQIFWMFQKGADEIVPWGRQHKLRDQQLRNFFTQENIFASALGIICSRNSGFAWKLDGPDRITEQMLNAFENANMGMGWHDLITKTTIDLCTQDNGAFWEIVRENDREDGKFMAVNHLDSARCWHTGNPEAPVIYMDRMGKYHLLKWFQVITFAEMPASVEGLYGLQYCTLTRLLRKAQVQRNVDILDAERTGGRHNRQIHLVKGITTQQMSDAIAEATSKADAAGLTRYMTPVIAGTLDPKADVGHDTIDLVTPPTEFDPQEWFKQYINLIAMAFESDYQEFAPLPGGGLGTGAQSEMLHLKSRGKGPGTFMKLVSHAINFRILPKNVRFFFDEQDYEAQKSKAEVEAIRAQTRAVRVAAGEITPQAARQIANDDGDLSEELMELMSEQDVTPNTVIDNNSQAATQGGRGSVPVKPGDPGPKMEQEIGIPANEGGRPNKVPSIRPPTPLGPKLPPSNRHRKELDEEEKELPEGYPDIKQLMPPVMADWLELKSHIESFKSRQPVRKVVERDKDGRISAITEVVAEGSKPYSSGDESSLPSYVKKMPDKARRQWVHVFNSEYQAHGDEGRAFASANSVAKKESDD
jgi:hypothetical protein